MFRGWWNSVFRQRESRQTMNRAIAATFVFGASLLVYRSVQIQVVVALTAITVTRLDPRVALYEERKALASRV